MRARSRVAIFLPVLASGVLAWATAHEGPETSKDRISFNRDVRPILSNNCFNCHGPDAGTREAELRLDTREGLFADLDGVPLIDPGDPENSELYFRIAEAHGEEQMPPPDSGRSLTKAQIETIAQWIREGADWEGHWSYQAVVRPELPSVEDDTWGRNPIDAFILAELESRSWEPSADADPRTLLRRLSFDLTGLPPTMQEVEAFAALPIDQAIDGAVETLLASPHHAERMAVHWLDLVRYADTVGYHGDQDRPMSPFRDYVLQAFADNMPFDRFVREQLAGDLLPQPTLDQQIASGYNRLNQITAEGGAQDKEYLAIYAADRVRTTATAFLGSTLACAQCHDHKFDPFSIRDFYSFAAFFADIEERGVFNGANNDGNWGPRVEVPSEQQLAAIQESEARLATVRTTLNTMTPELRAAQQTWEATLVGQTGGEAADFAWADEERPQATIGGTWTFVDSQVCEARFGKKVRQQAGAGIVQHFFHNAEQSLTIRERDRFYTHVWLDPENPPQTIMLQFNRNGSWEHRPFWGEDKISFGGIGNVTDGHRPMGDLPVKGEWVRLEVDPSTVGLKPGDVVNGMAFTQFGGLAYWDQSGLRASNLLASVHGIGEETQQWLGTSLDARPQEASKTLQDHFLATTPLLQAQREALASTEGELRSIRAEVRTTLVSKAREPRVMRVLPRGNWMDDSGEVVLPAVPAFLPQSLAQGDARLTRLDLADWITDRNNPLTARAFVNRLWGMFFGYGLARTQEDLGAQGEWPTHPLLLDWLASEFMDSGWDVRHMVRLIVTSRAYRQASSLDPERRAQDPHNRAFARQTEFRLEAEFIRDQALAVSGLLDRTIGGESVKPYQPEGYWRELNFPMRRWQHDADSSGLRRGLYTYWCRTFLHPSLLAFDAATREECTVQRAHSNTPQQALVLLNDPSYVEAARALALWALQQECESDSHRIQVMMQRVLQRDPSTQETAILFGLLRKSREQYQLDLNAATEFLSVGGHAMLEGKQTTELAAHTVVARALLNLHEGITRY